MIIRYYFEDVPSTNWNNRDWQWLRLGARARERYWFAGSKALENGNFRIFYFTLPVGTIAVVPPANPQPTPIPIPVDPNQA